MVERIEALILDELSRDANRSRKRIAHAIGISESYLSKKIEELVERQKVIKSFTIDINYEQIGMESDAITLIKAKNIGSNELNELADQISTLNDAIEVYTIFGDWDIFIRWKSRSNHTIMEQLSSIMRGVNIGDAVTIPFGRRVKQVNGPALSRNAAETLQPDGAVAPSGDE
jgi:DNA-binding Lrp family transcriptional regulator